MLQINHPPSLGIWLYHLVSTHQGISRQGRKASTSRDKDSPCIVWTSILWKAKSLRIPTLSYRRLRAALLFLYKYHHDLVDINLDTHCNICRSSNPLEPSLSHSTRGHNMKIQIQHHQGIRQRFFITKAIPIWNTLKNTTVNASSINSFKNQLSRDPNMPDPYAYEFTF